MRAVELSQDGGGGRSSRAAGWCWPPAGASYPATGSTGTAGCASPFRGAQWWFPQALPLVPLEAEEAFCGEMQGLALKT